MLELNITFTYPHTTVMHLELGEWRWKTGEKLHLVKVCCSYEQK
jgi:hypothetical protein